MLPIENDFSHYSRLDWFSEIEVGIRFIVELLAQIYDKTPNQIIEIFYLCDQDLPHLRYEDQESDNASDPQWLLFRYFTVLHTKDLLSRTLETSIWKLIQGNSLSCREEVKFKSPTYPSVLSEDIFFQLEGDTNGVGAITRIVRPPYFIPLEECWAYRQEVEQYLAKNRAFDGWLDLLPASSVEVVPKDSTPPEQQRKATDLPQWDFRPISSREWSIGSVGTPTTLKKMGGFAVIRSALQYPGRELSPHAIAVAPRAYKIADDAPRKETKQTTEGHFHEDLSMFMENTDAYSYTENAGGVPIHDDRSLADYKDESLKIDDDISRLDIAIASNQDKTSQESLTEQRRQKIKLGDYIQEMIEKDTRPDGKSRTDNSGDQDLVETNRLRLLVRRAIKKIHDNELVEISKHLDDYIFVAERYVIYEPIAKSKPTWCLYDPSPTNPKPGN